MRFFPRFGRLTAQRDARAFADERATALRRAAALVVQQLPQGASPLIAFAGPVGGEGSSVVAESWADSMGHRSGGRMVLVNAHRSGSAEIASDSARSPEYRLEAHLRSVPGKGYRRLDGFGAGSLSDASGAQVFAAALRAHGETALVVLPPLLAHPEALAFASQMDGIVLVLEAEQTRWEVARELKSVLDTVGVKVLGAVLNKRPRHIPEFLYRQL